MFGYVCEYHFTFKDSLERNHKTNIIIIPKDYLMDSSERSMKIISESFVIMEDASLYGE